jgi:hypothetical protein
MSGEPPIDPPALRASDAERERTATLLREHTAAGRLTPEELDERLETAYAARTVSELDALVHDLPASPGAPTPSRPPRSAQREGARQRLLHAIGLAVLVSAAAIGIWLAGGAEGDFWPKWVVLLSAIRVAFAAWAELGPAAGQREARLGRGGARPRDPLVPPPPVPPAPPLPREQRDER